MTAAEDTFHGWARFGKDQPLVWTELPLKKFEDDDIEINVTHCGICGSDIHTMNNGWKSTTFPCVVGHEIIGIITKIGTKVEGFAVGDRVGVGAQSHSCGSCEECSQGQESVCTGGKVMTYNSSWTSTGDRTYGGYADKWRGKQGFVFKIPEGLSSEVAAPLLCAGTTTYAPLKRHGVTVGSRVAVIGVGGLGHLTIQWAKAMGAKVTVISSSERKRSDAELLGADDYIVAGDIEEFKKRAKTLTHIVCASFGNDNFDWALYLSLLQPNGKFIMLAVAETPLTNIPPGLLVIPQISLIGSFIGSPAEIRDMLDFAVKSGVKTWVQTYPMDKVEDAVQAMKNGQARYRIVLEN